MLSIRRSEERGRGEHGWLDSRHTFSFASYYSPKHMGFGALRVINEDRVRPGAGFGVHPHQDMEIITYVLDGELEHRDSMGNGSIIVPGDVQHMSAGSGVTHSEYNASKVDPVHFLQIWVEPNRRGGQPRYGQKHFPRQERLGRLRLVASEDGREDSILVQQDVRLYATLLDPGMSVEHAAGTGRQVWVHVARGAVELQGQTLDTGDSVGLRSAEMVALKAVGRDQAEVLLFDLEGETP